MTGRFPRDRNPQTPAPSGPAEPPGDPVAYMLAVMEDGEADPSRRDGMAKAVAAYLRPKARAGGADGRELLDQAVAGSRASLAQKLGKLADGMADRSGVVPPPSAKPGEGRGGGLAR
jgi:hypothetical protein